MKMTEKTPTAKETADALTELAARAANYTLADARVDSLRQIIEERIKHLERSRWMEMSTERMRTNDTAAD